MERSHGHEVAEAVPRAEGPGSPSDGAIGRTGPTDDLTLVELRCSAVVARREEILLVRHAREHGSFWVLPGGHPRDGEVASAAIAREVLEETGISMEPGRVLFVMEGLDDQRSRRILEIVFLATPQHDWPDPNPRADEEARFFPLGALPADLYPPIGGYLRGASRDGFLRTASYLGNMWRGMNSLGNTR